MCQRQTEGMDLRAYLVDLRRCMDRRADRLDMQLLADAYVAGMSSEEISEIFTASMADWGEALAHAGHPDVDARTHCPVDGEQVPCRALRSLAVRYDVEPRDEFTETATEATDVS